MHTIPKCRRQKGSDDHLRGLEGRCFAGQITGPSANDRQASGDVGLFTLKNSKHSSLLFKVDEFVMCNAVKLHEIVKQILNYRVLFGNLVTVLRNPS